MFRIMQKSMLESPVKISFDYSDSSYFNSRISEPKLSKFQYFSKSENIRGPINDQKLGQNNLEYSESKMLPNLE